MSEPLPLVYVDSLDRLLQLSREYIKDQKDPFVDVEYSKGDRIELHNYMITCMRLEEQGYDIVEYFNLGLKLDCMRYKLQERVD